MYIGSGLLRACDYSTADRYKACEIFWTLGANQVGKAAIAGWRDLLAPAVRDKAIAIWPFDGDHPAIFEAGGIVVAFGILGMRERMEQIWVPSKLPAAREMEPQLQLTCRPEIQWLHPEGPPRRASIERLA